MKPLAAALAATIATAAAAAAAPRAAPASCPVERRELIDALSAIALDAAAVPVRLAPAVGRAAAMWNDAACRGAGGFPRFVSAGEEADRTIAVVWHDGLSPRDPTSCGSFAGDQIHLYGRARDPLSGRVAGCGHRERVAETLAHELGHVLGLLDQAAAGCGGQIMSRVVRSADGAIRGRRVQPEECRAADEKFVTAEERRRERGRQEPLLLARLDGGEPASQVRRR
jgi:hypothetical protein